MLILATLTASLAAEPVTVHLRGDFFGATYDTPLRIDPGPPSARDADAILTANAVALAPLARWVEVVARTVHLDDYGRLRLVTTAVDGLGIQVRLGESGTTVHEAVGRGAWTAEDRRLALGGGLRAAGYAVTTFAAPDGEVFLGVAVVDDVLNVHSVTQSWAWADARGRQEAEVRWVLWDGTGRIGDLPRGLLASDLHRPGDDPASGRRMRLADREVPAFVLRRGEPGALVVAGSGREMSYTRRPDAAAWLAQYPEIKFEHQVTAARRELRTLGLDVAVRDAARSAKDEVALVDGLIRTIQSNFTYQPGPVRSLYELSEDRRGDCDGLSALMAAMLLELGWTSDDLVGLSWGDHLALAARPVRGAGPDGGVGVQVDGHRFSVIDVTNYVVHDRALVSRWGASGQARGRSAAVLRLDGGL